jgi:GT2 family glycosyltransferase
MAEMRNAVAMLVYNSTAPQLELTKDAVASALDQDVPIDLFLVDNGSTDDGKTWEWMQSIACEHICITRNLANVSPVKVGNEMMADLFGRLGYSHILGIPNDVVLPKNLLREFLKWPRGIVTGSMTADRNFPLFDQSRAQNTCTPMAVALLRKWAWEALIAKDGYFYDPGYFHYASDCDFALRLAACGIVGVQLDLQYFHVGSASWRLAPLDVAEKITGDADMDRFYFEKKWGFRVDDPRYGQSAADINFRG